VIVDTELETLLYNTKDSLLNPSFIAIGDLNQAWRDLLQNHPTD